jgi:hypothetical protein
MNLNYNGRIRFLRVCNHRDVVTAMPNRSFVMSVAPNDAVYKHVGIALRLYQNKEPILKFPSSYQSRTRLFFQDMHLGIRYFTPSINCLSHVGSGDLLKMHSCGEYMDRLASRSEELSMLDLEDLSNNLRRVFERQGRKKISLNEVSSQRMKDSGRIV